MSRRTSCCASCPAMSSRSFHAHNASSVGQLRLFESAVTYDAQPSAHLRRLREAIAPYLCLDELRRLATTGADLHAALRSDEAPPDEVRALLSLLADLLSPLPGEVIVGASDVAARLLVEIGQLDHEVFVVVCLDTRQRIQRIVPLYHGTTNSTLVRVGEVFRPAIGLGSTSIIVAHNHPAGSTTPSHADEEVTRLLRQAGQTLDIELLDHLIIAQGQWASLREQQRW
jgi:hypothetical protein